MSPNVPFDMPSDADRGENAFTLHPLNTTDKLVKYWTNTFKTLDVFWENWKKEYLICLKEGTMKEINFPKLVEKRNHAKEK